MDCIIIENDHQYLEHLTQLLKQNEDLRLKAVVKDPAQIKYSLENYKPDVIFVNEDSSSQVFTIYQALPKSPLIIVLSDNKERAYEALNLGAVDFFLHPVAVSRLTQSVSKLKKMFSPLQSAEIKNHDSKAKDLFVRAESKIIRLSLEDINYIEALADYIMIFTKSSKHIVHSTMKGFIEKLPVCQFARIHRSYIINTDKIEVIENNYVVINGKFIPIGASYKEEFMKGLNLL